MTIDELIKKISQDLSEAFLGSDELKGFYEDAAEIAIDTIFAALQEPTEEMLDEARWYCDVPINTWQTMLNASPLKPKE